MVNNFGGFGATIIPTYKAPTPVKNAATNLPGSVAPIPKKPTVLPVAPYKQAPNMTPDTAPMMSTTTGPKPGYVTTPLQAVGGMSPDTKAPATPAPATTPETKPVIKPVTTKPTVKPTVSATGTQQFEDVNGNKWNTQAEADAASTPKKPEVITDTGTPPATTPEGDVATSDADVTPPTYDPVGEDVALSQAEFMQKSQQEKEFALSQRSIQTQIDTLTGEMSQLQSSETIRKTQDDLNTLRHNIAYLGTQGQPGLSSVKMDAIAKQLTDAETTFMNIKKMEVDKESQRTLGLEYSSANFEKQMKDLSDNLNANVNVAIQEALNGLTAAEMAGKIDTVEEVQALKGTLFQNLDKAIAGKVVANAADRKLIIQRYNDTIAKTEAWTLNKAKTDVESSKVNGYVTDGNGNPRLGANGNPIPYVDSPYPPVFDKESGNMMTFSTGKDGKIVTTVQKVFTPTEPSAERKPDSNGGFYRTVNGKLETTGGTGGKKALTQSEMLALDKALAAGEISQATYNERMGTTTQTPGAVSQYKGPDYTAATIDQVTKAYTQAVSQGDGARGGQCGAFVNNYLQDMGIGRIFTDPIDKKKAAMNSTEASIGSIAIMDSKSQPQYGHVGIVTAINADGTITLKQSNKAGEEKVFTSKVNASNISGYFDPQIAQSEALMSTPSTDTSVMNDTNESIADMLANYEITVAEIPGMGAKTAQAKKDIIARAKELNPEFSTTTSKTRVEFMKKWTSGDLNTNKMAVNTTLGHISTLADTIAALGNTKLKPLNQVKNWLFDVTGNPAMVSVNVTAGAVASEIAKVFKGGASPTEDEIKYWTNTLKSNQSPAQFKAVLANQTYLLASRMKTLAGSYKNAMGKYPDINEFLYPEAQATLQNLGLDPAKFAGIGEGTVKPIDTTKIGRRNQTQ